MKRTTQESLNNWLPLFIESVDIPRCLVRPQPLVQSLKHVNSFVCIRKYVYGTHLLQMYL